MSDKTIPITGTNIVGGHDSAQGGDSFRAHHPATGEDGSVDYFDATEKEIMAAVDAATAAFATYRSWPGSRVGELLRAGAEELEAASEQIFDVGDAETGLGRARMQTEHARTCAQLRAFAGLVEEGSHVEAIISHPNPEAVPPNADLRRMRVPLGPVAVFGASNFPLAFSVPGGDTASALAAGCPVVVKAHPSHPGTSELCARALVRAARRVDAPDGLVSMLHGRAPDVGRALVLADGIQAVGFTGSFAAGRALHDLGAQREQPIPVYAEMGSVNPVFVTERAVQARPQDIAEAFAASMTMGTGQFCTKPGLAFVPQGAEGDAFVTALADALSAVEAGVMLNPRIRDALQEQLARTVSLSGTQELVALSGQDAPGVRCSPALVSVDWDTYLSHPELGEEHFGPVSIVVRYRQAEIADALTRIQGSLAVNLHAEEADIDELTAVRDRIIDRAGRVVWNGFSTGVAVVPAQHHGGPYPATTDSRHTSVGTTAIYRFLRPVAFQGAPDALLPEALKEANPLGIWRLVDEQWTR